MKFKQDRCLKFLFFVQVDTKVTIIIIFLACFTQKVSLFSFQLVWDEPINGGRGITNGWFKISARKVSVCLQYYYSVWSVWVEGHMLKGVRLMYSFMTKILSVYGVLSGYQCGRMYEYQLTEDT